ncbi:hypothetical protein HA402_006292 [Bradysia odoriphaga]|nr:hypothetical protein HA402_006292 [Bradysia odoriphaga]
MALFQMKWLRNFVRRHTSPVPFNVAEAWKQRLSIAYALFAWNAFGFVLYQCYQGKADWAKAAGFKSQEEIEMPPAVAFAKQFGMEKARVIRVSGLDYKTYDIDNAAETEEDATKE